MKRWGSLLLALPVLAAAGVDFSAEERERILAHGPWPPGREADAGNRVEADPRAAALGRRLFADRRLSASGRLSCASCHDPKRAFQDGGAFARAGRNTPSLWDVAGWRWFGWDGAKDSLWAASLAPLVAADEIAATPQRLAALLQKDAALGRPYRALFGVPQADESVGVNLAKALAAWQATLVSPRTAFDDFRDALARGDRAAAERYPAAAQRGLQFFVGDGRCFLCHGGPAFTNGEFADTGRPFFRPGGAIDPGRWGGLQRLQTSPYNRLGPHSDAGPEDARAVSTRHVTMEPRHYGEFRVPGLRGLVQSAPYLHDGSLATIEDVLRHYSELDLERLHADGQTILRPLHLSPAQLADLAAFLRTLSAPAAAADRRPRAAPRRRRGSSRSPRRPGRCCGSVRCRTAASGSRG